MKQYNGENAIISLTSWKARINTVAKTIYSLITMCPGFHVVLVLSEEEFPKKEKDLPEDLMLFVNNDLIELLFGKENLRPHLKYFYTMQKYRNVPIITCDDDQMVYKNFAELLFQSYLTNKHVIHACRCHYIVTDAKNKIVPYNKWYWNYTKLKEPSFRLFATGVGTVLYPPNILQLSEKDIPLIKRIICQDDIYLKIREHMLGIKVLSVTGIELGRDLKEISIAQQHALNIQNTMKSGNDKTIKKYEKILVSRL